MKKLKCLVCGAVFDEGVEVCHVCGVGSGCFTSLVVEDSGEPAVSGSDRRFLILGGGVAGLSAAEEIRKRDPDASITIVSDESEYPYNRPMLTKDMFASAANPSKIAIRGADWYDKKQICYINETKALSIDADKKIVTTDRGEYPYDKLIIAVGSRSFVPPIPGAERAFTIRSIDDVRKLEAALPAAKTAAIIGGGVLGLEIAAELTKAGQKVTVLEMAPALLAGKIAPPASAALKESAEKSGVKVYVGISIEKISANSVDLKDGTQIPADIVVISAGVRANTDIAKAAGIAADRAITTNSNGETNVKDVYAAGDCASPDGISYCLYPEATALGKIAGANAAGEAKAFKRDLPAIICHAFTPLYAIGDFSGEIKTVEENKKYHSYKNGKLVGITLYDDITEMSSVGRQISNA